MFKDIFPKDDFPKFSFKQALWAYHVTLADFGFFISKKYFPKLITVILKLLCLFKENRKII